MQGGGGGAFMEYIPFVCVARDVVVVVWFGLTLYVIFKSKGRLCNVSSLVK